MIDKEWLEKNGFDLEPENIISEEDKQKYAFYTSWPIPQEVPNLGKFLKIQTNDEFDRVIGNPENWETIRNDNFLFENWILPNAVLLFGKTWFDRMKWAPSVSRGGNFPLFSDGDRKLARDSGIPIEDTQMGRTRISQIVEKVAHSLIVYLRADWYDGNYVKQPSGYIIRSIKNEITRDIAENMGFKMVQRPACPGCLAKGRKTLIVRHSDHKVSCEICKETSRNIELNVKSNINKGKYDEAAKLYKIFLSTERFSDFIPLLAKCPNEKCFGKFVPISCCDYSYSSKYINAVFDNVLNVSVPKTVNTEIKFPDNLKNIKLTCPHCNNKFKSKYFTGLPTIGVWKNFTKSINETNKNGVELQTLLVDNQDSIYDVIANKQRLNVIVDELVIKLSSNCKNSVSSLTTWYFYLSVIRWIREHPDDAAKYFFDLEDCNNKTLSIHQNIFHTWMDLLDENIKEFKNLDGKIKKLSDFSWFCKQPKFSDGPKSIFRSVVESNKIANRSKVKEINSSISPRIGRLLSVYRIINNRVDKSHNFINEVNHVEWNNIILDSNSSLQDGDVVSVSVLLMSGHCTNAPIQRILRLKSKTLDHIIEKIKLEEEGNIFQSFWLNRSKLVNESYDKLDKLIKRR